MLSHPLPSTIEPNRQSRSRSSLTPLLLASLTLHALIVLAIARLAPAPAARETVFEVDLRQSAAPRPTPIAPPLRGPALPKPLPKAAKIRLITPPKVLSKPPQLMVVAKTPIVARPMPRYPAPRPEQIPVRVPPLPQATVEPTPALVATPSVTEPPATPVPVSTPLPAAPPAPRFSKRPDVPAIKPNLAEPVIAPTTTEPVVAPTVAPQPSTAAPSLRPGPNAGDGSGQGTGSGQGVGSGQGSGSGSGKGSGSGAGEGRGNGSGNGAGQGNGTGQGAGDGSGQGRGSGKGEGNGNGSGSGEGNGNSDGKGGSGGDGGSGGSGGGNGGGGGGGGSGGGGGNGGGGNGGIFGLNTAGSGPRHIVYLLDISRSMIPRIDRARQELRDALKTLQPGESFNIIGFYAEVRGFSYHMVEATPDNITKAGAFLDGLELRGGTNFEMPLKMALAQPGVNVVVLISDGDPSVGETSTKKLTRLIRNANRNRARIFTVGLVGHDPFGEDRSPKATQLLQQIARDSGGECKIYPLD